MTAACGTDVPSESERPVAAPGPGPAGEDVPFPFEADEETARADVERWLSRVLAEREPAALRPESLEQWRERRNLLRRRLRSDLGLGPEPMPAARAELVDATPSSRSVATDGVLVERLVLWPAPERPVPALLHRPSGAPERRRGAVLNLHGHSEGGKDHEATRARARRLARSGLVVLSPDGIGHGERSFMGHAREAHLPWSAGATLLGLALEEHEAMLGWLASREDVDPERLAVVGSSYGGTQAVYLGALDDRVAALAVAGSLLRFETTLLAPQCPCNYVPGQLEDLRVAHVFALNAPDPLLAVAGSEDHVIPVSSARRAARVVGTTYAALDAADAFRFEVIDGGHGFGGEAVELAVAFLAEALELAGAERPASAGDGRGESREPLAGPVLDESTRRGAATLAEIAARRQRELLRDPVDAGRAPGALREALGLAGLETAARAPQVLGETRVGELVARRLAVESGRDLTLHGAVVEPAEGSVETTWLWLDPRGARGAWSDGHPLALARAGHRVVLADLRGQGDHPGGRQDALLLLVGASVGRPLLGQRVADAARWLQAARALAGGDAEIPVLGLGESGLVALVLAAAGADGVERLALVGAPATLVAREGEDPRSALPRSASVPGLLAAGDLPRLAELTGLPRLWLSPRLRDGRPATPDDPAWEALDAPPSSLVEAVPPEPDRRLAEWSRRAAGGSRAPGSTPPAAPGRPADRGGAGDRSHDAGASHSRSAARPGDP